MSSPHRETAARKTALPFRLHASVTCPSPAELALSLAWELGDPDLDRSERALTVLAAATPAELEPTPLDQLRTLGDPVAGGTLEARANGEVHLDRLLANGNGHPLTVAILLDELGRRAGLPVGIVAGESGHFIAHQRLMEPLVLDPVTGRLTDATRLGTLIWRCGHQVAAELLDLVQPRYERVGDLVRAVKVARLRMTLPFEDTENAAQRLKQISARLN